MTSLQAAIRQPDAASVIIPFHRDLAKLAQVLSAVRASLPGAQILVAADGSPDDCRPLAASFHAQVVEVPGPSGPATARNRAAALATGDPLLFVDADVVVAPDALPGMCRLLQEHRDIAGVFGAYDLEPPEPNFMSQFKNLSHAYVHEAGGGEASTFWAGLGAMRTAVFRSVGGFDERFRRPSVEDIELGYRVTASGHRLRLEPQFRGTHLKRWTVRSSVATDVIARGIPWAQLTYRPGVPKNGLNLSVASRLSVCSAWTLALSLALLPLTWVLPLWPVQSLPSALTPSWIVALTAAVALLALVGLNIDYFTWLRRQRGRWFAVRAVAAHWLHHLANGLSFVVGTALHFASGASWALPGVLPRTVWQDGSRATDAMCGDQTSATQPGGRDPAPGGGRHVVEPVASRTGGRRIGWLVAFLIPSAVLATQHWTWQPSDEAGDYAQYVLHARALVEGRPYAATGYIYHPDAWFIGPVAYPPGLPLLLVPIVALGGVQSALIRVLMLVSLLAFAGFAWRRLAMSVAPWQAAVAAGFAAFAIESRDGTIAPTSDVGFAALMWALILAADSATVWTWRRSLLVTVLGAATLAFRVVGAAALGAFAVYSLATWRSHRGRALVPVVVWASGGIAAIALGVLQPRAWAVELSHLSGVRAQVDMLVDHYATVPTLMALRPSALSVINQPYYAAAAVLMLIGLVDLAGRLWRSYLGIAAAAYLVMLVVSPVAEERYLWPLLPVGACALAVGSTRVIERLRRQWPALQPARVSLGVLGVVAVLATITAVQGTRPEPVLNSPDAHALYNWLRQAGERSPMRVVFWNPRVLTLQTGIPAMGIVNVKANQAMQRYENSGITHIVFQPDLPDDPLRREANQLPVLYPERFAMVYATQRFQVYRLLPALP